MGEHEKLERAEARIAELLADAEKKREDAERRLAEVREKLADAERTAENALAIGNKKAYADACTAIKEIGMEVQFYERRRENFVEGPLMEQAEFEALLADLYTETNEFINANFISLGKVLLPLGDLYQEITGIIERSNSAILRLKRRVMKVDAKDMPYVDAFTQFHFLQDQDNVRTPLYNPLAVIAAMPTNHMIGVEAMEAAKAAEESEGSGGQ